MIMHESNPESSEDEQSRPSELPQSKEEGDSTKADGSTKEGEKNKNKEKEERFSVINYAIKRRLELKDLERIHQQFASLEVLGSQNGWCIRLFRKMIKDQEERFVVKKISYSHDAKPLIERNFCQSYRFADAKNVVECVALYAVPKFCYTIMKYYDFPELVPKGGYSQDDLRIILKQILNGLEQLHSKSFYHRDIKPANILYDPKDKKIIIVDLGVGRRVRNNANIFTQVGTEAYFAPEMGGGRGYNNKVDVWALGITIYEIVCGGHPFEKVKTHLTEALISEHLTFPEKEWEQYSASLKDLVKKMLLFNVEKRFSCWNCLRHRFFLEDNPDYKDKSLSKEKRQSSKSKNKRPPIQTQYNRPNLIPVQFFIGKKEKQKPITAYSRTTQEESQEIPQTFKIKGAIQVQQIPIQ